MARKQIDITCTSSGLAAILCNTPYYAVARDEYGEQVAEAYGETACDAEATVIRMVYQKYPDAEILCC